MCAARRGNRNANRIDAETVRRSRLSCDGSGTLVGLDRQSVAPQPEMSHGFAIRRMAVACRLWSCARFRLTRTASASSLTVDSNVAGHHEIAAISCGRDHTLALLDSGRVFGWGGDGSGRMPAGTPEYCSTLQADAAAVELITRHELVAVAAGYGISLGVTATKRVAVWGASAAGHRWATRVRAPATPQLLDGSDRICAVAAGEFVFGAIDTAGTIHTWGLNGEGALGRPTRQLNAMPGPVAIASSRDAAGGGQGLHAGADARRRTVCWGDNAAGQLGLGHLTSVAEPRAVLLRSTLRSVAAGATHTLALTDGRRSTGMGQQSPRAARASGTPRTRPLPLPVALPERVQAIAAGMHFLACARRERQGLCMGLECARPARPGRYATIAMSPRAFAGLQDVRSIAAGETHAVALDLARTVRMGQQRRRADRRGERPAASQPALFFPLELTEIASAMPDKPILAPRFSAARLDARRRARRAAGSSRLRRRRRIRHPATSRGDVRRAADRWHRSTEH